MLMFGREATIKSNTKTAALLLFRTEKFFLSVKSLKTASN